MFKRALTMVTILAAFGLAARGFAHPPVGMGPPTPVGLPMGHAATGEQAVHVAKGVGEEKGKAKGEETVEATGDEKGKAKGEQHGRKKHQDKHRGEVKHQDKQRGEEAHQKP